MGDALGAGRVSQLPCVVSGLSSLSDYDCQPTVGIRAENMT